MDHTPIETGSRLWTVKAAARARGVYAPRLWDAIRTGELAAFQVGQWLRVRLEDVDAWIQSRRYDAANPRLKPRATSKRESRAAGG